VTAPDSSSAVAAEGLSEVEAAARLAQFGPNEIS
jgi:hypothetical protein